VWDAEQCNVLRYRRAIRSKEKGASIDLDQQEPADAGLYVVRPPGDLPPAQVRVLTDILLEYFGAGQSLAAV